MFNLKCRCHCSFIRQWSSLKQRNGSASANHADTA